MYVELGLVKSACSQGEDGCCMVAVGLFLVLGPQNISVSELYTHWVFKARSFFESIDARGLLIDYEMLLVL